MSEGITTTLKLLAETRNEAALSTLMAALESSDEKVRENAFCGILNRRSPAGHRMILDRWEEWDPAWKEKVSEHPGRLTTAIRDAVLSTDAAICRSGCEALLRTREYDLVPTLIKAIEDRKNPNGEIASQTLLELAELLRSELDAPRDDKRRRDPALVRKNVAGCLEVAVERFHKHQRTVLIEAFLILVENDNAVLRQILQQPRGLLFQRTLELLSDSPREGILHLLLSFLTDAGAVKSALNGLARRTDMAMVQMFLDKVGREPKEVVLANLKRLSHISWVINQPRLWARLSEDQQYAAIQVATHSGVNRLTVFDFLKWMLGSGKVSGRRAAASALEEFRGMDANELARQAMNDEDPIVLARILVQMRNRGIRVTLPRLLELADSPHVEVRTAVQQCLGDFTVQRYLGAFDMLDEPVRRTTGILVSKVDEDMIESLTTELESPSRTRRIRALQALPFLGVGSEVEPLILEAIQSDDHFVRSEAAGALVHCRSREAQFALREALLDSRSSVQEAAEQALKEMSQASMQQNRDGKLGAADLASLLENPIPSELGMEFLM